MKDRKSLAKWIEHRAEEDDRLYALYGEMLEPDHAGEFLAIGPDGRVILGDDELRVSRQAIKLFGAGQFALRRIGADAEARWRSARP